MASNDFKASGTKSLSEVDKEIYDLIQKESERQFAGLELIASENFTSQAVIDCLGSVLTNKYSEGYPGARYYGGNKYIDEIENLAISRALKAYGLDSKTWGVNVQPYSGSPANFAVYTGVLQPHDRIMGLDLPSGGHLTHGFYTPKKKISSASIYFESMPYQVDSSGYIDYDGLSKASKIFRPKLIISGASAYPREWNYKRLRQIADECGAMLMVDMAHISGLVASGVVDSPFPFADIVTTTTHKSLRGPRAGLIYWKNDERKLGEKINAAIFPGTQGGPHNNTIAAIAVQLKEVATPEFKAYSVQVRKNAEHLGECLKKKGYKLATDGTDNHLILLDVRPLKLNGKKVQEACDLVSITLNKNSIVGDTSALVPGAVRIGTPALTSRGFVEKDFSQVADFIDRVIQIAAEASEATKGGKYEDYVAYLEKSDKIKALHKEVEEFASAFPIPGPHTSQLKKSHK